MIAHFIKHKIINHAITFNFDEVLTRSLLNELEVEAFEQIFSDQQILPDQIAEKPRLIKIHGSINYPQTLKFTRDNTRIMSQDLINLLDNTFSINEREGSSRFDNKKLHIVSFGYSWKDKDFASYVLSRQNYISSITIIQLETKIPKLLQEIRDSETNVNIVSTQKLSDVHNNLESCECVISIDQLLWALWNDLEADFIESNFPYVPISRHLILGNIFGPKLNAPGLIGKNFTKAPSFRNKHTVDKRLYVEIYLHLTKCKGMVNTSNMAFDPRLNYYYKIAKMDPNSTFKTLDNIDELIQSKFADVKETYFAKAEDIKDLINGFIINSQFDKVENVYIPKYEGEKDKITLDEVPYKEFMEKQLKRIYDGPEVEILSGLDARAQWTFDSPEAINDYHAMQCKTRKLLEQEWSHLFVIAETTAWLYEETIFGLLKKFRGNTKASDNQKNIFSIRAANYGTEEWSLRKEIVNKLMEKEEKLSGFNEIIHVELPWWEHNRHLTLAYDKENSQFLGGIYFRRRLKTSRICPIYVNDYRDCIELFFTFLSYLRRVSKDTYGLNSCENENISKLRSIKSHLMILIDQINRNLNKEEQKRLEKLLNEI